MTLLHDGARSEREKDVQVRKEIGTRARKWFMQKGKDANSTLKLRRQ
jgi:hypothetical protein